MTTLRTGSLVILDHCELSAHGSLLPPFLPPSLASHTHSTFYIDAVSSFTFTIAVVNGSANEIVNASSCMQIKV